MSGRLLLNVLHRRVVLFWYLRLRLRLRLEVGFRVLLDRSASMSEHCLAGMRLRGSVLGIRQTQGPRLPGSEAPLAM
jgi:hypothetical protein